MKERKIIRLDFNKLVVLWENLSKSRIQNEYPKIPLANIKDNLSDYIKNIKNREYPQFKVNKLAGQLNLLITNNIFPELIDFISSLISDLNENNRESFKLFVSNETEAGELGSFIDMLNNRMKFEKEEKQILRASIRTGSLISEKDLITGQQQCSSIEDKEEDPISIANELYESAINYYKSEQFQLAEDSIKMAIAHYGIESSYALIKAEIVLLAVLVELNKWDELEILLLITNNHFILLDKSKLNDDHISYITSSINYTKGRYNMKKGTRSMENSNYFDAEKYIEQAIKYFMAINCEVANHQIALSLAWIQLSKVHSKLQKSDQTLKDIENLFIYINKFHQDKSSAGVKIFNSIINDCRPITMIIKSNVERYLEAADYPNAELWLNIVAYCMKELIKYDQNLYELFFIINYARIIFFKEQKKNDKAYSLIKELYDDAIKLKDNIPKMLDVKFNAWIKKISAEKYSLNLLLLKSEEKDYSPLSSMQRKR